MRVQPMAVCALRDLSATLGGDFANNFALPRIVSFGRDSSVYRYATALHRRNRRTQQTPYNTHQTTCTTAS